MLKIATRKSPLALKQTELFVKHWQTHYPELACEIKPMSTEGDQRLDQSLAKIGGKGLFIKELEKALLIGDADVAVHSMKDMPVELPPELDMMSILTREDARDAFVSVAYKTFLDLPRGAIVGTSSLRRASQLKAWRPDIEIKPLRGNVNTRLQKLNEKKYDAIILAAAGLKRLNLDHHISEILAIEQCLPAVGQGVLCVEFRKNNPELKKQLAKLNDPDLDLCVCAERAVTIALAADCHTPVAAYANIQNHELYLQCLVGQPDGKQILQTNIHGNKNHAQALGQQAAQELIRQGAKRILT